MLMINNKKFLINGVEIMIGTSCRVVNEYKVIIQFKIENLEG